MDSEQIGVRMDNELLTVAEVAAYLRINRTAIWKWRKTGKLPQPINLSPGARRPTLRFRRAEILALTGASHE